MTGKDYQSSHEIFSRYIENYEADESPTAEDYPVGPDLTEVSIEDRLRRFKNRLEVLVLRTEK